MKLPFKPFASSQSKAVKIFVSAALFATVLFAASAASQPATGQTTPTSDIQFSAPSGLSVAAGRVLLIDASEYASDGDYVVSCGTATGVDAKITVSNVGCRYAITAGSTTGAASFTVPYTSTGNDTHNGAISIAVTTTPPAGSPVAELDATGCTDGTFVDTTANPRVTGANNDLVEDCQALVAIQNHFAAVAANQKWPSTHELRNWGTGDDEKIGDWADVTVSSGRVTGLTLNRSFSGDPSANSQSIHGTLPTELGDLTALTDLRLSQNVLIGDIPTELGNLTSLEYLHLNDNQLTGAIPTQLGSLTSVTELDLSDNQLTGAIPTQLGSLAAAEFFDLSGNRLSGSIPTQLGSLTATVDLHLNDNLLSGTIPTQLSGLSSIEDLQLHNNRLTGAIPTQLATLSSSLSGLHICNNYLTGAVPTTLRTVLDNDYPSTEGYDPVACQNAGSPPAATSAIAYNPPALVTITASTSEIIDALAYVNDDPYTITCANATGATANLTSVTRDGCLYTVTAGSATGDGSFTIPYTSTGTDTENGLLNIKILPASSISFTAPAALSVARNGTLKINALSYATDGTYAITCGDPTVADATKMAVTRTAGSCSYTIDPVNTLSQADQGNTTFTISYASTGGTTTTGTITVNIGSDTASNIVFSPPAGVYVEASSTIRIDLSEYVSDGDNTVSCTSASARFLFNSVSLDGCVLSLTTLSYSSHSASNVNVSFSSSGGDTHSGVLPVYVLTNFSSYSGIAYDAPSLYVTAGQSVVVDASEWVEEEGLGGLFSIYCSDATSVDAAKLAITRKGCQYTITAEATATGTSSFTVPYYTSGLASRNAEVTININTASNLIYTAPTGLVVPVSSSITVDAASYAADGSYDIICGTTSILASLVTIAHQAGTCKFTVTADAAQGTGDFTVRYTSASGSSVNGVVPITVGPASNISFNAPASVRLPSRIPVMIDVSEYATDGPYDITSCGNLNLVDAVYYRFVFPVRSYIDNCVVVIRTTASTGTYSFRIDYTSSGGDTHTGTFNVMPSAQGNFRVNSIPAQTVVASRSIVFDASSYASDSQGHTIVCRDAIDISSLISSVSRTGCRYSITAGPISGTASFRPVIASTSQRAQAPTVRVNISPASDITYTPFGVHIPAGVQQVINVSSYATDGTYLISCGAALNVQTGLTVSQVGTTCGYSVTAGSGTGTFTFDALYSSTGGDSLEATVSVIVYRPTSNIVFNAPSDLELATNRSLTIDASDYAYDAQGYTISCADATSVDSKITIQRTGCSFVVTASGTQGLASFTVPYTSSGGGTANGVFTIELGPDSTIVYTAPAGLTLGTDRSMTIDAASYAADGSYTITCDDAESIDSIITVTRPNTNFRPCDYAVTPTGTTGTASFTVPYTSSGGHTLNGIISIEIAAASTIVFTAPTNLTMTTGSTLTINAGSYATDGSYTISCSDAINRDAKLTRITNTGCSYEITAGETVGTATFTVPYASTGGHALNGQISVTITARPRNTAPVADRQQMICSFQGYEPVRHSTADRITEADPATAFCYTPTGIVCLRGVSRGEVGTVLINIVGLDTSLNDCYNSIKG